MHPLLAFAATGAPPSLQGAWVLVAGEAAASERARTLALQLGMRPFSAPGLRLPLYHAAAALVASGAAALVHAGARLLGQAGVPDGTGPAMLGRLLSSVAENVTRIGVPSALTGPIRRGDTLSVQKHLRALRESAPELLPLYVALACVQAEMAAMLGDARPADLCAVRRLLGDLMKGTEEKDEPPKRQGRHGRKNPTSSHLGAIGVLAVDPLEKSAKRHNESASKKRHLALASTHQGGVNLTQR